MEHGDIARALVGHVDTIARLVDGEVLRLRQVAVFAELSENFVQFVDISRAELDVANGHYMINSLAMASVITTWQGRDGGTLTVKGYSFNSDIAPLRSELLNLSIFSVQGICTN